ncbi:protein-L-isoaspartate O-methyltransferase [Embleya sp. NPDC050154]|uniref:protein-L-isoaspartate O-methyltransferase n=1 Tax=Embleya sp. NPDC050154 TaxID=3363988 RepID=UPI00379F300C
MTTRGVGAYLASIDAMPSGWEHAFAAVERADFLPRRVWSFDVATGTYTSVIDRDRDPVAWHRAANSNAPLVVQWDDGTHTGDEPGELASSSASMPSVVADMLHELDVTGGETVLEVGTATGYTAALLAARGCRVVTIEIDPVLAAQARANLNRTPYADAVTVVTGDGALGHPAGAPYDRLHITAGVRHIPPAWIDQARDGAIILMPWGTDYSPHDQALKLTRIGPGRACGPFTQPLSFMKLRDQRREFPETSFPDDWPETSRESAPDIDVTDTIGAAYEPVEFVIGLHVRDCVPQQVEGTLWLYAPDTGSGASIAAVSYAEGCKSAAYEAGPRDLWGEVQAAYHRWEDAGKPAADRFGLTVIADREGRVEQRPWFGSPDVELSIHHRPPL